MPKIWLLGSAAALVVAGGVAWSQFAAKEQAPTLSQLSPPAGGSGSSSSAASALAVAPDDHVLGKADAPITIIEYASLTCPHCATVQRDIVPKLKEEWVQTGKAKFVYRNFPLNGPALMGAKLAECVKGDRYFGMIDVLLLQMDQWAGADPAAGLTRLAKLGGLSEDQVRACLADGEAEKRILSKQLVAQKELGVTSTPTFFINGKKIVGGTSYEQFREALVAASKS